MEIYHLSRYHTVVIENIPDLSNLPHSGITKDETIVNKKKKCDIVGALLDTLNSIDLI